MSNRITRQSFENDMFYKLPKFLFNSPYRKLSNNARVLYSLLKDRLAISLLNNWVNDKNELYLIFTRKDIEEILGLSNKTVIKTFKELTEVKLIEEERLGLSKPNRIFLLVPSYTSETNDLHHKSVESKSLKCENYTSEVKDLHSIKNNINKTNINKTNTNNTNYINSTNGIYNTSNNIKPSCNTSCPNANALDAENKKLKYINNSEYENVLALTRYLINLILRNNPKAKTPNTDKQLNDWCTHIDRLIRIDGYTELEIKNVITFCQNDIFWKSNILSTAKLRKQFDKLYLKAKNHKQTSMFTDKEIKINTDW